MFVRLFFAIFCVLPFAMAYNTCTSRIYDFVGYTFKIDTNTSEKVWTHCKMPNPVYDAEKCGRVVSTSTNYVCDPDYLMNSVSQGESIDLSLYNVQTNTSTVCTDEQGQKQSFLVAVLLLDRVRMPDFQSPNLCENECGEIHPELDTTNRTATEDEEDLYMEHFADKIRELWALGSCDNDVIVFYCQELNKVHISVGSRAKEYISDSDLSSLTAQLQGYIDSNRLEEGLFFVAEELRFILQGVLSPAKILLIIGMAITFFVGLFLAFILYAGERDLNAWGSGQPSKTFEWIVYTITGVWVIKGTMLFSMMVSHKFPYWGAGICFMLAVIFFVLYVLDVTILGDSTLLTTSSGFN